MSLPSLIINTIVVPFHAAHDLGHDYNVVESVAKHRMGDGTLIQQVNWRKLSVTISALGSIPPALHAVDWDSSVTIKCAAPRTIQSTSNVITLPTARRSDVTPIGLAIVGERLVETPINIVGDVATLTTVSGAAAYRVDYYPQITCIASPPSEQLSVSGAAFGWTLEAQET